MAASVYAAAGGSAVGPSLPLFLSLYERNCIRFDHAYGWEATKFDEALWWRHVPADVRPRLTFYNEPVTAAAFVDHLATHTHPEDFVVLKVDIDGGPEVEIVEEIARRPELAARVDELFFEYHFDFDGLDFGWHIRRPGARHSWGGHGEPDAAAGVVLEAARPQAAQGRVVGGAALLPGPGLGPG